MGRLPFSQERLKDYLWFAVLLPCLVMSGCSGNNAYTTSTQLLPAYIILTPTTTTVEPGSSVNFTDQVVNLTDTSVSWEVNGIEGGNSTVGTISASGLYKAPDSVPGDPTVTVTVVSVANPTIKADASVTIGALRCNIQIAPTDVTLQVDQQQQFKAVVGCVTGIIWEVEGIQGGSSRFGTITSNGLYTAPGMEPGGDNTVTVEAIAQVDNNQTASTTVTICASCQTSVIVSPELAMLQVGQLDTVTATVNVPPPNDGTNVCWSIQGSYSPSGAQCQGEGLGQGQCGTITTPRCDEDYHPASYQAPLGLPSGQDGLNLIVTATLKNYPVSGYGNIRITPQAPMTVSVSCGDQHPNCEISASRPPTRVNSETLSVTVMNQPPGSSLNVAWTMGCITGAIGDQHKCGDPPPPQWNYLGPGQIVADGENCWQGMMNLSLRMLSGPETLTYHCFTIKGFDTSATYYAPIVPIPQGPSDSNSCGFGSSGQFQLVPLLVDVTASGPGGQQEQIQRVCIKVVTPMH